MSVGWYSHLISEEVVIPRRPPDVQVLLDESLYPCDVSIGFRLARTKDTHSSCCF